MKAFFAVLGVLVLCVGCGEQQSSPDGGQSSCSGSSDGGVPVELLTTARSQYLGTRPSNAYWVAAQDGTCDWHAVQGTQGSYQFAVQSGRYGLAIVCAGRDTQGRGVSSLSLFFLTTSDASSLRAECPEVLPDDTSTQKLVVTLDFNLPGSSGFWLDGQQVAYGTDGLNVVQKVSRQLGAYDVVLGRFTAPDQGSALDGLIFRRGLDSSIDQALEVDVHSPEWTTPEVVQVASTQRANESVFLASSYLTGHHTRISLGSTVSSLASAGPVSLDAVAVPVESRAQGELHDIRLVGISDLGTREVEAFTDPAGLSLPLPEAAANGSVSCPATGCTVDFSSVPDALAYTAGSSLETDAASRAASVMASPAYLGGSSSLPLPDLGKVAGWDSAWGWQSTGSWTLGAVGGNQGLAGELRAMGVSRAGQPISELDGLVRWSVSKEIAVTGK